MIKNKSIYILALIVLVSSIVGCDIFDSDKENLTERLEGIWYIINQDSSYVEHVIFNNYYLRIDEESHMSPVVPIKVKNNNLLYMNNQKEWETANIIKCSYDSLIILFAQENELLKLKRHKQVATIFDDSLTMKEPLNEKINDFVRRSMRNKIKAGYSPPMSLLDAQSKESIKFFDAVEFTQ